MTRFTRLTMLSAMAAGLVACGGGAKLGGGKDGAAQASYQASKPTGRFGQTSQQLVEQALASGAATLSSPPLDPGDVLDVDSRSPSAAGHRRAAARAGVAQRARGGPSPGGSPAAARNRSATHCSYCSADQPLSSTKCRPPSGSRR